MNYSETIKKMQWSYSRITSFESCPYGFYLKYIYPKLYNQKIPKVRHFFSDYGSFIHSIIEKYLNGELNKKELVSYYLTNFKDNVVGRAPNRNIFSNYFQQGIEYLKTIEPPKGEIIGVEKKILFKIEDKEFIGFIDSLVDDDGLVVIDNKSRNLKPRSKRKKPTKTDEELDNYLRQLYLYAVGVEKEYGQLPKWLCFNCFRTKEFIKEPFIEEKFENTKKWAIQQIQTIEQNEDWSPNIDWFRCQNLCDMCEECEYFQMTK